MLKERQSKNVIDKRTGPVAKRQNPFSVITGGDDLSKTERQKAMSTIRRRAAYANNSSNPISKAVGGDDMQKAAARQKYFSKRRIAAGIGNLRDRKEQRKHK